MAKTFSDRLYHSKQWKAARAQAMHRDMYTCRDCGGRATEVHHIVSLTPENINDPMISLNVDNLQVLCWQCHNKRTLGLGDVNEEYMFDENGQVIKI